MSNMVFKSESTGNNYKKSENMWNDWSDNIGAFTKLNNMEKNDIEGTSGTNLARSLTVFSNCMLSECNPYLDGKRFSLESRINVEDYWNDF